MARIVEETYTIKLSKLVKNDGEYAPLATDEFVAAVEAVAAEMVGDEAIIVEVIKDPETQSVG